MLSSVGSLSIKKKYVSRLLMEIIRKWDSNVIIIRGKRTRKPLKDVSMLEISGWEMFQTPRKTAKIILKGRRNGSSSKERLRPQGKPPVN